MARAGIRCRSRPIATTGVVAAVAAVSGRWSFCIVWGGCSTACCLATCAAEAAAEVAATAAAVKLLRRKGRAFAGVSLLACTAIFFFGGPSILITLLVASASVIFRRMNRRARIAASA